MFGFQFSVVYHRLVTGQFIQKIKTYFCAWDTTETVHVVVNNSIFVSRYLTHILLAHVNISWDDTLIRISYYAFCINKFSHLYCVNTNKVDLLWGDIIVKINVSEINIVRNLHFIQNNWIKTPLFIEFIFDLIYVLYL